MSIERTEVQDNRKFLLDMMPKNSICAEIGVAVGNFSSNILQVVNPRRLYLVDPWHFTTDKRKFNRFYGGRKENNQEKMDEIACFVKNRFKDKANVWIMRDTSKRWFENMVMGMSPKGNLEKLDWIYIDGDHDYEPCKADVEGALKIVKTHGFICLDDYAWGPEHNFPVKKVVHEYMKDDRLELIDVNEGQIIFQVR